MLSSLFEWRNVDILLACGANVAFVYLIVRFIWTRKKNTHTIQNDKKNGKTKRIKLSLKNVNNLAVCMSWIYSQFQQMK